MALVNSVSAVGIASGTATGTVDMATGGATTLLVVLIVTSATTYTDGSATDSSGNSYAAVGPWAKIGNAQFRAFVCTNPVTTTTMTATATWGGPAIQRVLFIGYSGRSTTPIGKISNVQGAGTSAALSQFAPTVSGSDYLAAIVLAASRVITAGSGWTVGVATTSLGNWQTQDNVSASVQDKFSYSTSTTQTDYMIELLPAGYLGGSVGDPPQAKPPITLRAHPAWQKARPIAFLPAVTAPLTQSNVVFEVMQPHHPAAMRLNPDTSQGMPKTLSSDAISPLIASPQSQPAVRRDVLDTSYGASLALLLVQAPATGPPSLAPPWRPWLPSDTSQSVAKALYADALAAVISAPSSQIERPRTIADASQGSPSALTSGAAPFAAAAQPAPLRFPWQPPDTSQATPKVLYGDLYQPAITAPTPLVDPVRQIADTSRSSPQAALSAQAPFTAEPGWAPPRFWWQPSDTSAGTPKTLYADTVKPFFDPPPFQADPVRPVYDTSRGSPIEETQPPTANPGHLPPLRFWWQPADTSAATPKPLYTDQFKPAFDAPQFQVDRVRPVYDTSRGAPIEEVQAPLVTQPHFAPQRYPWLPADTSAPTPKTLYADALTPRTTAPQLLIGAIRAVTDTSRSTPAVLLQPAPAPFTAQPWWPPLRPVWQPGDTSQSTPKAAYPDLNRAFAALPTYQVDRRRSVVDTSQSTPAAITAAPVAAPPQTPPQPASPSLRWQPSDTSQSMSIALQPGPPPPVPVPVSGGGAWRAPGIGYRTPIAPIRPPKLAKLAAPVYDVAGSASSANAPQSSIGSGTVEIVPVSGEARTERAAASIVACAEIDNRIPHNRRRAALLAAIAQALSKIGR